MMNGPQRATPQNNYHTELLGVPMRTHERAALTLQGLGLKTEEVSLTSPSTQQELGRFLVGELPMTPSLAFAISRATGMSATSWMDMAERERLVSGSITPFVETEAAKLEALRHVLKTEGPLDMRIQAAISLGNVIERDLLSGSALLYTAAYTSDAQLFRACVEGLAAHSRESAEAICEARFESGDMLIKVEALHGLYGYNPSAALRRAFDTLSDVDRAPKALTEASREVARRYSQVSDEYAPRAGEEAEAWQGRLVSTLAAEVASGRAPYEFVQPEGYTPTVAGATLGAFFEEKDPFLRRRCLINLRSESPGVAEIAALAAVGDSEPLIRISAALVLHFIDSSASRAVIEGLQYDTSPLVASNARILAGQRNRSNIS